MEFWIKILFFKKNFKNNFELKLLSKIIRLSYVNDNMINTTILNNNFTIFLKVITAVMNNDLIIFLNFNCR